MKLISTTEFAIAQYKLYESDKITAENYANRVKNYAMFISQPLDPSFFIGNDENILVKDFKVKQPHVNIKTITYKGYLNVFLNPKNQGWEPCFALKTLEDLRGADFELTPLATKLFL